MAAHEYGHHLQSLVGIRRAFEERVRAARTGQDELKRRYELQADCLGSVWGSLSRSQRESAAKVA
ncbi:neutral zinc metallopeptidase [Nonomuraea sp. SYSU D8015]|uniref:neutral zinc metallopeptidase n=1 Tax=Nonomuraea sp. SYSU D8015 TaxID=2593644 RepID=UPI001CB6E055|nr:neutral zinc metallopeptidase [Nonomuraea sp. SYSU D8015]